MYDLLNGLSVIEASSFVASPSAGLYCAQMGAEVIRVDQIGGGPDYHRWPVTQANDSVYWGNLTRAKKAVALDLGRPGGREVLQRLVRATGQFITNFPATGFLSHEVLAEGRADLVTVRVMGWADGSPPLDYTVNNAVGYPMMTGAGPEPVNHVLPAWDLLSGAYAAFARVAAIRRREQTGAGGEVRVPLSDVAIGTVANLGGIAEVLHTGANRPRLGNAVYGLFGRDFVTADGVRTMIVVVTPRQWDNLVAALGLGEAVARSVAALAIGRHVLPSNPRASHRFDVRGAVLNALTLCLIILGIDGAGHGQDRLWVAAELGAGLLLGVLFVSSSSCSWSLPSLP